MAIFSSAGYRGRVLMPKIKTVPQWNFPTESVLARVDLGGRRQRLVSRLQEGLDGLSQVHCEALIPDGDAKASSGTFQRFHISRPRGRASVSAEMLARLIIRRCEVHAMAERQRVTYRIYLIGKDEEGDPFRNQAQFTIKPGDIMASVTASNTRQEDPDPVDEASQEDGTETDLSGNGEAEEEEEEEDEEDDFDEDQIKALARTEGGTLVTQAMNVGMRFATKVYRGTMEENRAMLATVRNENTNMMRDMKVNMDTMVSGHIEVMKGVTDFCMSMMNALNDRMDRQEKASNARIGELEGVLTENAKLSHRHYENLSRIAQHGFMAFEDAMKEKEQMFEREAVFQRTLLGQDLRLARADRRTSTAGTIFSEGAPSVLAFMAGLFRTRFNDPKTAKLFEFLSRKFAARAVPDEEEEEEYDEEDVVDTSAHPGGNGHAGAHAYAPGNGAPEPSAWNPRGFTGGPSSTVIVARMQAFRQSFAASAEAAFREALPAAAWRKIEDACNAASDDDAVVSILALEAMIKADPNIGNKLLDVLTEEQLEEIEKINEMATKYRGPRRPPPRPGKRKPEDK